uniref:Immunoglobulin domain-containing protein n=1 Tax=Astyanax mexicanus TaxID=7994 RepID=A0A3B1IS30_ASTMX
MKILKILLIFTVSFISGEVDYDDVTGYKGGSVLINCYYTNPHTKYFCKLDENKQCIEKFLSNESTSPNPDQKIFSMDDTQLKLYSLLIKNISQQDAGTYRCGVEKGNKLIDVKLEVEEDTCCGKSFLHKAHPGETVTFTCKYPAKFQQYFKYLYNVTNHNLSVVIYTLGSSVQKGRFFISDHTEQNLFKVSISNLTVEDTGVYLCGAQKIQNGKGDPYFSLFSEMQLQVERHSIPLSSGSLAVVIAVSVCVILLVIGGVGGGALIFYKRRQTKTRDSASASSTRRNSVNSEEAHQGPYYEEIPDNQPSSSTVYATAENPRAPSNTERAANRSTEPPAEFYSMAQLSNPASGVSAVYATVDDCT